MSTIAYCTKSPSGRITVAITEADLVVWVGEECYLLQNPCWRGASRALQIQFSEKESFQGIRARIDEKLPK